MVQADKEDKYLEALNTVLKDEYPENYYSLNGYRECAYCLQKDRDNRGWEVYCGERNNHFDSNLFNSLYGACIGMIDLIGDKENTEKMIQRFVSLTSNLQPA